MSLLKITENIPETHKENENAAAVDVAISYPSFEGENSGICARLNKFYSDGANEFLRHIKSKFSPTASQPEGKTYRAGMKWYISFLNEKVLSLITDVYFYDGKKEHTSRVVHNWDLNSGLPLRAGRVFDVSRGTKTGYIAEICSKISAGEGGGAYREDAVKRAKKYFDFNNFYFTPRGVAFYYSKTYLSLGKNANPAFVIPYKKIKGIDRSIFDVDNGQKV